jgi:hypothetical protein
MAMQGENYTPYTAGSLTAYTAELGQLDPSSTVADFG